MMNNFWVRAGSLGLSVFSSVFCVSLLVSVCPSGRSLFAQGAGIAAPMNRHKREQAEHDDGQRVNQAPQTPPSLPAQPNQSAAPVPGVAVEIMRQAESAPGAGQSSQDFCVVDINAPGGGTMDSNRETEIRRDLGAVSGFFQHLNNGSASPELLDYLSKVDATISQFGQSASVLDDKGLEILADSLNQGLIESGLMEVGADGQIKYLKTADSQGFVQIGDQKVRTDEVLNYIWQKHSRPKMVQAVGEEKTQDFETHCAFGMGFCSKAGCKVSRL